jgi:hypothetical protein
LRPKSIISAVKQKKLSEVAMMRNKSLEVEDAIIELGKVQSLTNVLNIGITDSPNVNDIQNAYYIVTDMFQKGYAALQKAWYGEVAANE